MRPRNASALGFALLLVACGSGGSALDETAAKLNDIDSAALSLEVTASSGDEAVVGFGLTGPFSFVSDGELPIGELELTERRGDEETQRTLISDGDAAFLVVDGQAYQLPDDLVAPLQLGDDGDSGLGGLDLAGWVDEAETKKGTGGTEVITGGADAVAALNDLLPLMAGSGAPTSAIEGEAAQRLTRAVERSEIRIVTGADDRILRRLELSITFGARSGEARRVLGELGAPQLEVVLELDRVNEEVRVDAPEDARPYSELG